jgi:hypothetical protein
VPYSQAPGLRLRPVPELGICLAFTPSPPRLHTLNPGAWLIAELSARHGNELELEFLKRSAPRITDIDAVRQFRDGVQMLIQSGIIAWSDGGT